RIVTALSGALLTILCLVMAPAMVEQQYKGRAIGIISMGVSGALVLGVPIGLVLGNNFGWRAPFIMVAILTIISIVGVHFLMNRVQPMIAVPLRAHIASLTNPKVFFALLTTFLYMSRYTALYAYLKPFIEETMALN